MMGEYWASDYCLCAFFSAMPWREQKVFEDGKVQPRVLVGLVLSDR
jgi:hypothetical protein